MGFYQLKQEMTIKATKDEIWDFISSPENLKKITPKSMSFDITSKNLAEKIYPGMIISYTVKPLLGIKTLWVTEITQVKDKEYFIDEQRIGPYKIWHHEHFIESVDNGIKMIDIISYQPPFGFLGSIVNYFVIGKKLKAIFLYRKKSIEKIFNS